MVTLGVDRALLVVKDLVELVLRLPSFFTARGAIDSLDDIVWLSLALGIPLVTAASMVIVALPIIVVATASEATALLFLLICPTLHHVT